MCTMWVDGYNGARHLQQTLILRSQSQPTSQRYALMRVRGDEYLRLLSCGDSTFKYDMASEDAEGNQDSTLSVFTREPDASIATFTPVIRTWPAISTSAGSIF